MHYFDVDGGGKAPILKKGVDHVCFSLSRRGVNGWS
jgi:hypothetical protein